MSLFKKKAAYRASVLWQILPKAQRRLVARHLSHAEIQRLNESSGACQSLPQEERTAVEAAVHAFLQQQRSRLPAFLALVGLALTALLFLLHLVLLPRMPVFLRLGIFNALLLGALGPLSLYLLPAWKARFLFRLSFHWEYFASAFAVYLCLIWLLTEINALMPVSGLSFPMDLFSKTLLFLGALGAPLFEEVVFRELLPSLFGKEPYLFGQAIGALLFAASHLPSSMEMFFYYTVAGGLLSALRIQSGGLLYGLVAHSLANAVVSLL